MTHRTGFQPTSVIPGKGIVRARTIRRASPPPPDEAPCAEIVRGAERFASDLIVIGNRGSGGIPNTMLGSVVRGVLRRAPCPTLVVSEPRDEMRR